MGSVFHLGTDKSRLASDVSKVVGVQLDFET